MDFLIPRVSALLFLLATLLPPVDADANPLINPIKNGSKVFLIRKYAQLPKIAGHYPSTTGFTSFGSDVYVATSNTGLIYKIDANRIVSVWMNVTEAVKVGSGGRDMNFDHFIFSGVRSVAMHPTFKTTGLFYISYLENRPADERRYRYLSKPSTDRRAVCDSLVTEFRYDHAKAMVDPHSYREVLRIGLPRIDHPIRQIAFQGNFLLITHGDGSHGYDSFVDEVGGGQNNDALGKILRINPLKPKWNSAYSVPDSNPFKRNGKYLREIYALGLRNPHSICYSRRFGMFSADVGRHNIEEVNIITPGANYGWAEREGTFVHKPSGGTTGGIDPLPDDDEKYNYTYPAAMYGHDKAYGEKDNKVAIAGGCPVETNSTLKYIYIYCNFPTGIMYYSTLWQLKRAVTKGSPDQLSQATVFRPTLLYDHDDDARTRPERVNSFLDIVKIDRKETGTKRADIRLGVGPKGETLVSSKTSGRLYTIVGTLPGSSG